MHVQRSGWTRVRPNISLKQQLDWKDFVIVQTPIGRIEFEAIASGAPLLEPEVRFLDRAFSPELPPGMKVEKVVAVIVLLKPASHLRNVSVRCRWLDQLQVVADPESGEHLDAQSWQTQGRIVTVGTEDFEALHASLPQCGFAERDYPVQYHPHGIEIHVPLGPSNYPTSFHFVVAINSWPESTECSAWYAVDVPHKAVLALLSGS
ncbi:MAG: hypothetical protein IPK97_16670 [Ahniella sp.]|nr:hypothetical protein [Ahniella sp.]